jgi:acyl-coenzyme A thioesterase PaaI-like protein
MSETAAAPAREQEPSVATDGGDLRQRPVLMTFRDFRILPHHCFACGELNEIGLHLELKFGPDKCHVELAIPNLYEGWEGLVHGGIVCTILDEVMAWALIDHDNWGVTARMSVDFKRPVMVEQAIRAEGWIVENKRRIQRTAGYIVDAASGLVLATAEATYVAATDAKKRELKERYGFGAGER